MSSGPDFTRKARRLVDSLFQHPELLHGTSLKPRHRQRWIYLGHEVEGGEVSRVRFGLMRHPRPYAFSRQSHQVAEYYTYDVAAGKVIREGGVNITRRQGVDADDPP
ncbi:MAG: hypothetical protein HY717_24050 [Planctomycetes bacterium]|nr:hypothetical protein [Planctomycetota bacterium]